MDSIAFDTHSFVKELTDAGMPEQQAEVLARTHTMSIDEKLATKQDLRELELRLKHDLTLRRLHDGGGGRAGHRPREAAVGGRAGRPRAGRGAFRSAVRNDCRPPAMRGTSGTRNQFEEAARIGGGAPAGLHTGVET